MASEIKPLRLNILLVGIHILMNFLGVCFSLFGTEGGITESFVLISIFLLGVFLGVPFGAFRSLSDF